MKSLIQKLDYLKVGKLKKIKNVFISTVENKFKLVNIYFDSSIRKLEKVSEKNFEWKEINTISKRKKIAEELLIKNRDDLLVAIPGGIDSHVHFDTPGFEFREDFSHASKAAIYGGTTSVIDMPCTSIPPVTTTKNLEKKKLAIKNKGKVNCYFWGGVSGNNFNEYEVEKNIFELAAAGVVGFKVYVISGMESFTDLTYEQIKFVATKVAQTGKILAVHAEDKELVLQREKKFKKQNKNDWQFYCKSRDVKAEITAVEKLIEISEQTKCRIHIVHLSSKRALGKIRDAQKKGIPISTETCPHYLYFTQKDFTNSKIRNFLKTAPPVKNEKDKNALWKGLKDGTIIFVTTDHAGCNPTKEKTSKNFWEVYGGIPGVEHRVPFLFSEGFLKNKISFKKTVELLSANPAEFFELKNKGKIEIGYDADIVLIDLWHSKQIKANEMHSKGKYTLFENIKLNAIVKKTFIAGQLVSKGANL